MDFEKKKEGFHFLGLDKQQIIKYFFGGNASLAIFILALICAFLLKEAWLFLPSHHEQLQTYRRSGLEYFTWIEEAYQKYKIDTGGVNRAWQAELSEPNIETQKLISAYDATRLVAERLIGDDLLVLKDAISQRKDAYPPDGPKAKKLDKVIEEYKRKVSEQSDRIGKKLTPGRVRELKKIDREERKKIVNAIVGLDLWERGEAEYYENLQAEYDAEYAKIAPKVQNLYTSFSTLKNDIAKPLDELWLEAFNHSRETRDRFDSNELVPQSVRAQVFVGLASEEAKVRELKFGTALRVVAEAEFFGEYPRVFYIVRFGQALEGLNAQLEEREKPYLETHPEVKEKVEAFLANPQMQPFIAALKGEGDLDAALQAIPKDDMPEKERKLLIELCRLEPGTADKTLRRLAEDADHFVSDFPFDEEAETIYALTPRYHEAIRQIEEQGRAAIAKFPARDSLKTDLARKELRDFRASFEKNVSRFKKVGRKLDKWRHDRSWTYFETLGAFFLGDKWTNNSQIVDRYGILPMLSGSFIISIIALVISVPISVAGAIYVNQIASFREQSFIKPTLEFIEAIPSIVLGFLGIVVVGQMLKDLSFWTIFSWLPGFPIDSRLNMLTAGLLLAFMAVPIIFTLAEDALNNVPTAYRDGALSLGATRLQTAFRVVLPASLSGVLAAVLLGFGRVIGETMVVLLVAGNRISIPDFTKGLGVVTEPTHTMTGIIAQGLGEAAKDSVDYRALFMVGLVLFFIALVINYIGQRILAKYEAK